MLKAHKGGVDVPRVEFVDPRNRRMVLEFVSGRTTKAFFEDGGVGVEAKIEVARRIGRAVAGLHAVGIVHGDLTTSNLMVRREGKAVESERVGGKVGADEGESPNTANLGGREAGMGFEGLGRVEVVGSNAEGASAATTGMVGEGLRRVGIVSSNAEGATAATTRTDEAAMLVDGMNQTGVTTTATTQTDEAVMLADGVKQTGVTANVNDSADSNTPVENKVVVIDFGLSFVTKSYEDMGVDLYVLQRAFLSTHPNSESLFENVLEAYKTGWKHGEAVLQRLTEVQTRGRKRMAFG